MDLVGEVYQDLYELSNDMQTTDLIVLQSWPLAV